MSLDSYKVHVVCPVFPPESVASAIMSEHIAIGLAQKGHDVIVITSFPSKMKGELFPGYQKTLIPQSIEDSRGFRIYRVFTVFSKESKLLSRLRENFSYALASNLASIWLGKPDLVYMNTWPAVATFVTALLCKLRGVKYIYNVQDIYPESAAGLGVINANSFVYRLLLRLDQFSMRHAAQVVPNSEEFSERIRSSRFISGEKITVVWNWYDASVIPGEKFNDYRLSFAPEKDSCVVMYAGNIGSVAGLEVVLDAAHLLNEEGNYTFVLAGDGTLRQELENICKEKAIENVKFYYPLHRRDLAYVQAAADILLITTKRGLSMSEVPSKIMGYMLSGRPVLAMVDAESNTAKVIQLADCGLVGPPENAPALARLVRQMNHSQNLDNWGRHARIFSEEHFDQEKSVAAIVSLIERLVSSDY